MEMILNMKLHPEKSPRNQTMTLSESERLAGAASLQAVPAESGVAALLDHVFCDDSLQAAARLPSGWVDLLFLDPPYNLDKAMGGCSYAQQPLAAYEAYLLSWLPALLPLLKPGASVYLCGDWRGSAPIQRVLEQFLVVRNRITWQREKGRGALHNWKNCTEDIWFATIGNDYYFSAEAVKLRRKVVAPYRVQGEPRDWEEDENGKTRLTFPSNFWDDLTVPYWSMPENTEHPAQKPEKLLAKLLLASSRPGDVVFDPFLGSGTSAVVARKLGRRFCGIERSADYCLLALKRLELASANTRIQGYVDGVFWERNSQPAARRRDRDEAGRAPAE